MHHYTYLIQHKTSDKRYIGVRSSKCLPQEDKTYWGSSKHLPKDVKLTHVKIILKVFSTRKEAVQHEINLHKLNSVATNPQYYNKANQTSTGFDTAGTKLLFSDEHKRKISQAILGTKHSDNRKLNNSNAQKALYADGYINPRTGITMSETLKQKISEARKTSGKSKGINNTRFSPWFITKENITYLFYDITKEEQSLNDGYSKHYYQDLSAKSKGVRPIKTGKSKGLVIGNIPNS